MALAILLAACETSSVPVDPRAASTNAAMRAPETPGAPSRGPVPSPAPTAPPATPEPTAPGAESAVDRIVHCSGYAASTDRGISVERGSTWSGYVAALPPRSVDCVEAAWVEPEITCGAGDSAVAIWVGIGGYTSVDLGIFDDGRALERAGTGVDCEDEVAEHYAWFQAESFDARDQPFGKNPDHAGDMAIAAGDRIWAQVRFSGDAYELTVVNLSSDDVRSATRAGAGRRRSSADWVVGGEAGEALARFSSVRFTDGRCAMAGRLGPIGSASWLRNEVDEWAAGFRRLRVSPLSRDGDAFRVTWLHR